MNFCIMFFPMASRFSELSCKVESLARELAGEIHANNWREKNVSHYKYKLMLPLVGIELHICERRIFPSSISKLDLLCNCSTILCNKFLSIFIQPSSSATNTPTWKLPLNQWLQYKAFGSHFKSFGAFQSFTDN